MGHFVGILRHVQSPDFTAVDILNILNVIHETTAAMQPVATSGVNAGMSPVGWQVTLCDPIWHVSSRSGEAG